MGKTKTCPAARRLCLWAWLGLAAGLSAAETNLPTVGMEGKIEVSLPGTLLEAGPVNPRARITVRVADSRPHGTLIHYDLRFIGLVPGRYDLREYLVRKDGSATNDLPAIPVAVAGLLPKDHPGSLEAQSRAPLPFLGGYRVALIAGATLWLFAIFPLWLWRRTRKAPPAPIASPPAPTLAERLKPLVSRAAQGQLSRDELAHLERLLLSHWRERLGLEDRTMIESVQQLRSHPEGGVLLRHLEDWLHRPPGSVKVDLEALLAPYRESAPPQRGLEETP